MDGARACWGDGGVSTWPPPAHCWPQTLSVPSRLLTQGGALLGAQGATGLLLFLLLLLLEAAAVFKLKVVLHCEALQQPAHRPALALGGQKCQLSWEGQEGSGLAGPQGRGGDATCLLTALVFTLPAFLPLPRMALALRGDRAMDRAPFFRCRRGGAEVRVAPAFLPPA